ncbi:MAG: hypothetical protein LBN00_02040 [Oscillospiraceae bacterium]|jgi:hypothetical protein|nr:hypothetical protein [Oscillospiraceae bacterium]
MTAANEFFSGDEYTFKITRKVTLNDLPGTGSAATNGKFKVSTGIDGDALPISRAYTVSPEASKFPDTFVVAAPDAETLYITAPVVTQTNVKLYFGDGNGNWTEGKDANGDSNDDPLTIPYKLDLSAYTASNDLITIPFKLAYEGTGCGVDSEYTLKVSLIDYTPVITAQPQSGTYEKNALPTLSVAVEETDGGELSYQWYSGSTYSTPIAGATDAEYTPPLKFSNKYDFGCVVTRTVDGTAYTARSGIATVTVLLTYLTPPEFTTQPVSPPDTYQGQKPATVAYAYNTTDTDCSNIEVNYAKVAITRYVYRNTTSSYDGGTLLGPLSNVSKCDLPAESEVGTYYYWIELVVSANGKPDAATRSDIFSVTVRSISEKISELTGDGSAESPWLIKTYDDLCLIRDIVNSGVALSGYCVKLDADIALASDWVPIGALKAGKSSENNGADVNPFGGTFDGGGHLLTVADYGRPLFKYVRQATVKNLNIFGSHIAADGLVETYYVDYNGQSSSLSMDEISEARTVTIDNVTLKSGTSTLKSGFIGGYASGVNIVTIRNCTVEEGVVIGYDGTKSGIGSFGGEFNGYVENSVSYATVKGVDKVGGLVGGLRRRFRERKRAIVRRRHGSRRAELLPHRL